MDGGLKVVAGGHLYRQVRPCHCRAFSTAMVAKTLPFSCVSTAMSTLAFVAKTLPSWQRHCLRCKDTAFVAKRLPSWRRHLPRVLTGPARAPPGDGAGDRPGPVRRPFLDRADAMIYLQRSPHLQLYNRPSRARA